MSEPTIRHARLLDVPLILRFIREAAHEQAPGYTIEATEETLTKTLHFSPSSAQDVLPGRFAWPLIISSSAGDAAGLLIYFFNYSTWSAAPGICLEELYVVPEYRRHGYAQMLVEAMAGEAKKAGCAKMDWVCLQGNQRALKFYEKMGAKRMEDWTVLKVGREGIEELAARARPVSG